MSLTMARLYIYELGYSGIGHRLYTFEVRPTGQFHVAYHYISAALLQYSEFIPEW